MQDLFGPQEGWSLAPIVTWLYRHAQHERDASRLIEGLAGQLDIAGASVDRIVLVSQTLHPQIVQWSVFWSRQTGLHRGSIGPGGRGADSYVGSPVQFVQEQRQLTRLRVDVTASEGEHGLLQDLRSEGITDYVALPMVFSNGTANVLTLATSIAPGFSENDIARFVELANMLRPLVEIIAMHRTTLGLLDTFVGPRISERILQGQVRRGDGDRIEAAFWYSDLRGFTRLSEGLSTAELLELLNDYFENCAVAAAARGGEILQFIGDAILIVFEISGAGSAASVCQDALDAATDAFASIAVVNHRRRHAGKAEIEFGLGLHVGQVTHANVGSPTRLAFNVVGPAVNLTARIQAMTKELGEPLIVSAKFASMLDAPLRSLGRFELRGLQDAEQLFAPI